jgi:hypothetical protein
MAEFGAIRPSPMGGKGRIADFLAERQVRQVRSGAARSQ